MISGLYSATTGLYAQQIQQEVLAYNISNVNVPGFKQQKVVNRSFPDILLRQFQENMTSTEELKTIGPVGGGTKIDQVYNIFNEGMFVRTDDDLNVALDGPGMLAVSTPYGTRYTRNGSLTVDQNLELQNSDGFPLLNENGNSIFLQSTNFKIDGDGFIYENGIPVDKLMVTTFRDPNQLIRESASLFAFAGDLDSGTIESGTKVQQGFLERSNVEISREMVNMIEASRAYESNQKIIQILDNTLDKAVNSVGRSA